MKTKEFTGMGVSPGVCIAKAKIYTPQAIDFSDYIKQENKQELSAFRNALSLVLKATVKLEELTKKQMGEKEAQIFFAHRMILEDEEFIQPIEDGILEGKDAPTAVEEVSLAVASVFENMQDEYMQARGGDILDIKKRLQLALLGKSDSSISALEASCVIVAKDLTPSDTANMDKKNIVGIITLKGSQTSHTAIMANALGIPALLGVQGILEEVCEGDTIALNANEGWCIINPSPLKIQELELLIAQENEYKNALEEWKTKPTLLKDGSKVILGANIGTPLEADLAFEGGGENIGLFRSEFLYMEGSTLPSEDKQYTAYSRALQAGKLVIIRTLDVGGDKQLKCLNLPEEENPFLGLRAIRLCACHKDLFITQLRALLRSAKNGKLGIMFPMISSLEELLFAKDCLREAQTALKQECIPYGDALMGIMIEIPSAALIADELAKHCDFLSIGTNDLIQYTVAVDRGNSSVAHLYSKYNAGVLRLIKMTIDAAHKAQIPCKMCGEMAGDREAVPLLIGMGLDEFSMSTQLILGVRKQVAGLNRADCVKLADKVLKLTLTEDIKKALATFNTN